MFVTNTGMITIEDQKPKWDCRKCTQCYTAKLKYDIYTKLPLESYYIQFW